MDAKAGFYALAVSAALVMASGAMLSNDAMAQSGDEAPVQTDVAAAQVNDVTAPADDVAVQDAEAPVETGVAAVQDEAVEQPVPKQKPTVVKRSVKSNLNQSAVRAAPVTSSPRPTRTSTRAIVVPKILGSYR